MTHPILTVDGSSGVGKGSLCKALSDHLNWHLLDSGALYRLVAYGALKRSIATKDLTKLVDLALNLDVVFESAPGDDGVSVIFEGEKVNAYIRNETCGSLASQIATLGEVRSALLQRQRDFARAPGLVADGRDMGTVVFPESTLKIFLTASAQIRAERRYLQLQEAGSLHSNQVGDKIAALEALKGEIEARDVRDMNRAISPLEPAHDAIVIDTTALNRSDVLEQVLALVKQRF